MESNVSDVQAGIQFIYHMREHLTDIAVATAYGLVVYAAVLWITKKKFSCIIYFHDNIKKRPIRP